MPKRIESKNQSKEKADFLQVVKSFLSQLFCRRTNEPSIFEGSFVRLFQRGGQQALR